ncbi:hypothetical protein VTN00DRAFT_2228 [Thermoascus crustaceus]|uniref:uncharacterized protein n=1 Tax=Thermoascus crustaceus TaxID=5088 RepID=UPI003741FDCA
MAALHQALECLAPTTWDSVPVSPPDNLRAYVSDIFRKSRLIVESVPEPPPSFSSASNESNSITTLSRSSRAQSSAKSAYSPLSSQIVNSSVRTGTTDPLFTSLQKEWGKPIKVGNGKENPLDIPVYKLAGKDGRGSWFARRSVHEGLPFSRWKEKMQSEVGETLRMREERRRQGVTPDTSIRGIGGDKRVESIEVRDADGKTLLGRLEVYELSAQFPGPTTARDFVTLLITTDRAFDEADDNREESAERAPPRSYLIVSKPCDHPETPPREGYIRGQYESVELIREVRVGGSRKGGGSSSSAQQSRASSPPLRNGMGQRMNSLPIRLKNKSAEDLTRHVRKRGKTDSAAHEEQPTSMGEREGDENRKASCDESGDVEEDMSPVEWIMVTRSDPGGSVPRWMVDRGTPKSIVTDAAKFLNWACQTDGFPEEMDSDQGYATEGHKPSPRPESRTSQQTNGHSGGMAPQGPKDQPAKNTSRAEGEYKSEQPSSLISSVASMVNTGLEMYAPRAVLNYIPGYFSRSQTPSQGGRETVGAGERDSIASTDTFTSADTHQARSVAGESTSPHSLNRVPSHTAVSSSSGGMATPLHDSGHAELGEDLAQIGRKLHLTSQEKTLAKLASRKREIERKLAQIRAEEESLGLPPKVRNEKHHKDGTESERTNATSSSSRDKAEDVTTVTTDRDTFISKPGLETLQAHKSASNLSRSESKLLKQLTKIEEQQLKVTSKIEARRRKEADRSEKSRTRSEVENLRREVQELKKEVGELRGEREHWLDLIGRLQSENTKLAAERHGVHHKD